ncbi:phage fiber-tail adaptor protein [Kaarinaea lacus]
MKTVTKDPDETLDYKWDWSEWLSSGVLISTATFSPATGITVSTYAISDGNTSVVAWVTGGTVDNDYRIMCEIETDNSPAHTANRTMVFQIRER